MSFFNLTLKNISGTAYRSWVIGLCAFVLAAFTVGTTLIMRGAETSLRLALDRLGADIIVVPQGSETKAETALLMGKPASIWMPAANQQKSTANAVETPRMSGYLRRNCIMSSDLHISKGRRAV